MSTIHIKKENKGKLNALKKRQEKHRRINTF